jgi:hypothetical protein
MERDGGLPVGIAPQLPIDGVPIPDVEEAASPRAAIIDGRHPPRMHDFFEAAPLSRKRASGSALPARVSLRRLPDAAAQRLSVALRSNDRHSAVPSAPGSSSGHQGRGVDLAGGLGRLHAEEQLKVLAQVRELRA